MNTRITLVVSAFGFLLLSFCGNRQEELFTKPSHFPEPVYKFQENPLTPAGVALGKTLFYDALLSKDNTVSCGSCHQQSAGFTQHGHSLSHGINDLLTKRNSMPLFNLAWSTDFGWDGGVHHLDLFAISPLQNPAEMDESLPNVLEKLRYSKTYPPLFEKAFGTDEITAERMMKALSQFMLTLVSANSRYDKYLRNEVTLTADELDGMKLFEDKGCKTCHAGILFTDQSYRNNGIPKFERSKLVYTNGVPSIQTVWDEGRYEITKQETDRFKFKVPSLRNIAESLPYMHDGRFKTLQEVLNYYDAGVQDTPNLDPILKQNGRLGIPLNADEKRKIIAFLNTLTDTDFLKDKRFAEPDGFPVR